jgi:hypothetical protein
MKKQMSDPKSEKPSESLPESDLSGYYSFSFDYEETHSTGYLFAEKARNSPVMEGKYECTVIGTTGMTNILLNHDILSNERIVERVSNFQKIDQETYEIHYAINTLVKVGG